MRSRLQFRFFWQLLAAFALVILLVGGGMYLAGRFAFGDLGTFPQSGAGAISQIWIDRLARHYSQMGSWADVDALIAGYPCAPGWAPWDQAWQVDYTLAATDGTVIAASDGERLGHVLRPAERVMSSPIWVGDDQVGFLHVFPLIGRGSGLAARGFLFGGLLVAGFSLVVSLVLSRGISRPVTALTAATRSVADGNLDVRVPTHYPGEIGELAVAFNTMAAELAHADLMRRNLTADVAHELRTPLSVIRGRLEGVLDGVYPAAPEHLQPVLEQTQLLTQLVEDLRLLALAEAGQLPLEKRPLDVGDLLRDAQVNFGPQAEDRGVTLALDLPDTLPQVSTDGRRVAQIVGNLLTNALRHTPAGGCVTLSASVVEGTLTIAVTDTGTGIAPEDLPYVFERFWRGEKSRSRAAGGTGLGLAIAKQLVEMHGGTIHVESTAGQGSRFWFTLAVC